MRYRRYLPMVPVLCAVVLAPGAQAAFPGENGKIAFQSDRDGNDEIYVMDADGSGQVNLSNNTAPDEDPAWSPDGRRIAFTSFRDGNAEIYVMNEDGTGQVNLTRNATSDARPAWSPDGRQIAFQSNRDGTAKIHVMNADGSGQHRLTDTAGDDWPAWSPNGEQIAFMSFRDGNPELYVTNADGSGGPRRLTNHAEADAQPSWSPDGQHIAFARRLDDHVNDEVWVMNADGSGQTNVSNAAGLDAQPAWSPDGQRIAFASFRDGNAEVYVMNAGGSGQVNRSNNSARDFLPDWQPLPGDPVVFIPGFMGSTIFCGAQVLWPDLLSPGRGSALLAMRLAADGRTNAGCGSVGPMEGQLVESVSLGPFSADVYGSAVAFLRDLDPNNFHLYAWDWRKSPDEALAGLEELVDRVRRGEDGKVVLMAHSMGGLVVRAFVDDQDRADKVSRAVTIATPYWGSPKAMFPFVYGIESPALSQLDPFFSDDAMREFARNLQGLFFLWPSARYGPWLSIQGRPSPLSEQGLLDLVGERGGNQALLATALGAHAARLDELRTGGVDYQTVIGSGIHTIGAVDVAAATGISLAPDTVRIDWVNGDGTVPLTSAVAATPTVRRHFVCGISHVPLPGHNSVTARLRGFLLDGDPIETLPVSGVLCEPQGFAASVFRLSGGIFAQAPPPGALTPAEAERQGRIELLDLGRQLELATSTREPLKLSLGRRGQALRIAPLENGRRGRARVYGPLKPGRITLELGERAVVRRNGKRVRGRRDDTRAPMTRVKVRRKGRKAILTFKVRDASPTTTYVRAGKRVRRLRTRTLRLPAAKLRRRISFQSVDAFGNVERMRHLRARR